MEQKLYTLREAPAIIGVSKDTLRAYRKELSIKLVDACITQEDIDRLIVLKASKVRGPKPHSY